MVVLNKKTGYELTTVHHRPPKKLMASPNKAEGSSQAGSSKKRAIALCLTIAGCAKT